MHVIAPARGDKFTNENGLIANERINRFHEQLADKANEAIDNTETITTKGDILSRTSSALARLAVGADNTVLTADSSESTGLKWASATGGDFLADGTVPMTGNIQLGGNYLTNDGGATDGLRILDNSNVYVPGGNWIQGDATSGAGNGIVLNDPTYNGYTVIGRSGNSEVVALIRHFTGSDLLDLWADGQPNAFRFSQSVTTGVLTFESIVGATGASVATAYNIDDATGEVYFPNGIGIGNSSPSGLLDVGDLTVAGSSEVHIRGDDDSDDDPGLLIMYDHTGTAHYLWVDNTGDLRIHTSAPTDEDADGTVVGSQS